MNNDYQATARDYDLAVDHSDFPIETARFRSMPWLITLSVIATCLYGWVLQESMHVIIPLALQFIIGGAMTMVFNISGTLLVDQHPKRPATAQAANNLMRCSMAALGLAAVEPLLTGVDIGWCYTIFAIITASGFPLCLLEMSSGMKWRLARKEFAG
jgi:hypothetical protein